MLISPNQIRAARGLLDWTVKDLGAKVGVGATTISAIETGRSAGSLEVISAIIYAFQSADVEIMEDGGVRPTQSKVSVYRGEEGFRAFFDDVYEVARTHENSRISITNNNDRDYERWLGETYDALHMKRMAALKQERLRVLLRNDDYYLPSSGYCEYRWVPPEQFADVSLYIYGNKSGFIEFMENDVRVTVVENAAVTEALRKMFELSWNNSSIKPA